MIKTITPMDRNCLIDSNNKYKQNVGDIKSPQCIDMQTFSNSSELLTTLYYTETCSDENFMMISQTVQELSR